jgi:hypothetical protein
MRAAIVFRPRRSRFLLFFLEDSFAGGVISLFSFTQEVEVKISEKGSCDMI